MRARRHPTDGRPAAQEGQRERIIKQHGAGVAAGGDTRSVLFYDPFPLTFARGEGAIRWIDGHEYVDLLGEVTAGIAGHSHPSSAGPTAALEGGINLGGHNSYEPRFAAAVGRAFVDATAALHRFRHQPMCWRSAPPWGRPGGAGSWARGGYHGALLASARPHINAPFDFCLPTTTTSRPPSPPSRLRPTRWRR